jgi:hypothetical protein
MAADVTFVNQTKTVLYLRAFNSKCSGGLNKTFSLSPGESEPVTTSGGNAVCYLAFLSASNPVPVYCDTVTAPTTVTFDAKTSFCRPKPAQPVAQDKSKVVAGGQSGPTVHYRIRIVPKSGGGGGGTVYLEDEEHLHAILANWTDPLTPPRTETRCSNEAWGDWPWGGQWRICVGWEIDCQWMENELDLDVSSALTTPYDTLKNTVDMCLKDSVVAAAVAGVISALGTGAGGLAVAEETFHDVFLACLTVSIPNDITSVQLNTYSHWSDWRPCVAPH